MIRGRAGVGRAGKGKPRGIPLRVSSELAGFLSAVEGPSLDYPATAMVWGLSRSPLFRPTTHAFRVQLPLCLLRLLRPPLRLLHPSTSTLCRSTTPSLEPYYTTPVPQQHGCCTSISRVPRRRKGAEQVLQGCRSHPAQSLRQSLHERVSSLYCFGMEAAYISAGESDAEADPRRFPTAPRLWESRCRRRLHPPTSKVSLNLVERPVGSRRHWLTFVIIFPFPPSASPLSVHDQNASTSPAPSSRRPVISSPTRPIFQVRIVSVECSARALAALRALAGSRSLLTLGAC